MKRTSNPCADCPDRRPGDRTRPSCHADCERYAAFRARKDAEAAEKLQRVESPVQQYINASHRKAERLHRWHKGKGGR